MTASAILAAQVDFLQGNGGSWIQSSLFHSQSAMLSHIAANYLTAGIDGKRFGTAHPSLVPYQSFMTADEKYLTIGAGNNNHFKQLCQLIDLQESDIFIFYSKHEVMDENSSRNYLPKSIFQKMKNSNTMVIV